MSPLTTSPKCKQRRFDTWAGACERRQCGYEDKDLTFPDPEPVLAVVYDLLIALQDGWLDSNYCELCRANLIPESDGENYGHETSCLWSQARTKLANYRMVQKRSLPTSGVSDYGVSDYRGKP